LRNCALLNTVPFSHVRGDRFLGFSQTDCRRLQVDELSVIPCMSWPVLVAIAAGAGNLYAITTDH
jgi:hypothetical protein